MFGFFDKPLELNTPVISVRDMSPFSSQEGRDWIGLDWIASLSTLDDAASEAEVKKEYDHCPSWLSYSSGHVAVDEMRRKR